MKELVLEICNFGAGEVARDLELICGLSKGPNRGTLESHSEVRIFLKKEGTLGINWERQRKQLDPNMGQARVTTFIFRARSKHTLSAL